MISTQSVAITIMNESYPGKKVNHIETTTSEWRVHVALCYDYVNIMGHHVYNDRFHWKLIKVVTFIKYHCHTKNLIFKNYPTS